MDLLISATGVTNPLDDNDEQVEAILNFSV